MSNKTLPLDDRLYQYLISVSVRESECQTRLREETAKDPMKNMQISPEQGQFMALLVALISAQRIIEIGTFTGYSALSMAMAMPKKGYILCCDINQEWTDIARRYWQAAGVADRIELRLAPALQTLESLLEEGHKNSFDLAFIDADKENYTAYYETCLQLIRKGGLILVDNTLWSGAVADPENQTVETQAIRKFNADLSKDERVRLSLVPIADGLTIALKR